MGKIWLGLNREAGSKKVKSSSHIAKKSPIFFRFYSTFNFCPLTHTPDNKSLVDWLIVILNRRPDTIPKMEFSEFLLNINPEIIRKFSRRKFIVCDFQNLVNFEAEEPYFILWNIHSVNSVICCNTLGPFRLSKNDRLYWEL